ncbi:MAG: glutamate 5-kinase, partial [Candidatus Magasanikbacteria bacterium]|nr:glutamate 5-kinase [Candidatus Magasanikbacteria bacterium]
KIGTNVITNNRGLLNQSVVSKLAVQVAALKRRGYAVVLVTSGAMGAGRSLVKPDERLNKVERRQVLAATGQIKLVSTYLGCFKKLGLCCAQVLTCKEDFRDKQHYLNMRGCLRALLKNSLVPIVNENDVVAVEELMFTDNDELAGLVAGMIKAKRLIVLTTVDGVKDNRGRVIKVIKRRSDYQRFVTPEKSSFGRGGMSAKCATAMRSAKLGIQTHIISGKIKNGILKVVAGEKIGTVFMPQRRNI